ncbi:Oidioi.mRNA.OKI2018_I69.XSR.g15013.t1.cds [Oikopleura dioica]|uniref:Oidioi.mRNA.OKI2018_I69.XSR.g15013.t1.cds n=1 Tax=Oikopleura dioica TaxID=34765 RepID=A0ABN7SKJ6_OIKDI|nr:Oidioi.mRNA.OKI2018_I69.XSR.g15013.t1.cds [Oikopleura dioica]
MAASVALSTFGAANGNCLTGARLTLAGARNGHLPRMLAYLSITERLPILSVIFNSALSIILLIPENSNFLTLVNFTGFTIWIFYGMAFAAVLILRWKCPDIRRRYKILPILCALVALFMTIAPIVASPEIEYLVVCGIIAAGLLIYIPLRLEFSFSLGVRAINWIEKQLQLLLEVAPYEKLASE